MIQAKNYHSETTRVSKSSLSEIAKSPAHYHYKYLSGEYKKKETPDFAFGSLFHCIVQEPAEFTKRYYVAPFSVDRRTKDGKNQWKIWETAATGKKIIPRDHYTRALDMKQKIFTNPIIRELYSTGVAEKIFTFKDRWHNVPCKIMVDWLYEGDLMVDLKTTDDASPDGFARSCRKYGYTIQSPFYKDGFETATGKKCRGFIFVAVEKEPPHHFAMYQLDATSEEYGRQMYIDHLETYKKCKASGVWPGYSDKIEPLRVFV